MIKARSEVKNLTYPIFEKQKSVKCLFKILPLLALILIAFSASATPPMYTVDYKLLVGLHPRMGGYDLVLERHLRSDINFADSDQLNRINMKIASSSFEANRQVEKLQRQMDRLQLEKAKIENRMTGVVVEFDKDLGKFEGDSSRKHQARKISDIDRDIAVVQAKIDLIWDKVMDPLYLSKGQSRKIVDSVLSEIDLMLEQFSTQLGNAVIIDSGHHPLQAGAHGRVITDLD